MKKRNYRTYKESIGIMQIIRNASINDFPLTQEAKELQEFLDTEMEKHKRANERKESMKLLIEKAIKDYKKRIPNTTLSCEDLEDLFIEDIKCIDEASKEELKNWVSKEKNKIIKQYMIDKINN